MTTHDNIEAISEIIGQLDPAAFAREVDWLTGGRIKAWSAEGVAARSANTPLPLPDRLDKSVRRDHRAYKREILAALHALRSALARQDAILAVMHDGHGEATDEAREIILQEAAPQATECINCAVTIYRTANDKVLAGRCRRCYRYWTEHGEERPQELWAS